MYFKLSARNVKRSFKDYFIYFLTLTFSVCIFYSFNSMSAQEAMLNVSASQSEMIEGLVKILSAVSIFVSIVLGFLIIFANNFLIRRRKKELGLYMTLGMSKYKISRILVVETLFVGIFSLIAGLLTGVFISQGLSVLTAKMFEVDITKYVFIFSSEAMMKTIFYFGIIFFLVMIFNSVVISRYKLIDLITASAKNEVLKVRKTSISFLLFIISLIILGISYGVILKYGLIESMKIVWFCVALGSIGTFLFFMSLSGFALNVIQRNKKIYFKDINMFVLRQINSKVNTTFISMTIICIMLFFTIGVLSTGFSYKTAVESDLENTTPYDASIFMYVDELDENSKVTNIDEAAKVSKTNLDKFESSHIFIEYKTNSSVKKLLKPYQDEQSKYYIEMLDQIDSPNVMAIALSDYNALIKMQGGDPVSLKSDEVLLTSDVRDFEDTLSRFVDKHNKVGLNGEEYQIKSEVQRFSYLTGFMADNFLTAIVPDQAISKMNPVKSIVNIQYGDGNKEKYDADIYDFIEMSEEEQSYDFVVNAMTKTNIYDAATGSSTILVYIGMYLGIVFLISSAAVLALQQLSEASDNKERYTVLQKIGVTRKGIHKAIFRQIFIYFMMPLSLAVVHSIFGIKVVNQMLMEAGKASVLVPSLITGAILVVVYGGYFLATYSGYKNIVK